MLFVVLLFFPFVLADNNLYLENELSVQLDVNGKLTLAADGPGPRVDRVSVELLLFPKDNYRQEVLELSNNGEVQDNSVKYSWNDKQLGTKEFGYSAYMKTTNARQKVKTKIPFPLSAKDIKGYEQYTLPSPKIDSNNPDIVKKAAELVGDEDDEFKAVFNMAKWVTENVEYKLDQLTTEVAQPASWVLKNKRGACDEMTSLFVAMARSQGIPARFVSGISFTEQADVVQTLGTEWAPHGWAEVYFPGVGWVSFDLTFDEYGYIDVTHIILREGLDPDEPATKYEWFARDVKLEPEKLSTDVKIRKEGTVVPEEIALEQELLASEVDFGSYNLVKGILRNTADYYAATTLRLATPPEVQIQGENKRTILLAPKETKETYWIIKVQENLPPNFLYEFPSLIYSEKNVSVQDTFTAQAGKAKYTKKEIDDLTVKDEEKGYSRKVTLSCEYEHELMQGEESPVTCMVKNMGAQALPNLNFCVAKICETISLPRGGEQQQEITLKAEEVGWQKIIVSAENNLVEKRTSFPYVVLDKPNISIAVDYPSALKINEDLEFSLDITKISFGSPEQVLIKVTGLGFEKNVELQQIQQEQTIKLKIENPLVMKTNKYHIASTWKDKKGKSYSTEQEIVIPGKADTFGETISLWFNTFTGLFM